MLMSISTNVTWHSSMWYLKLWWTNFLTLVGFVQKEKKDCRRSSTGKMIMNVFIYHPTCTNGGSEYLWKKWIMNYSRSKKDSKLLFPSPDLKTWNRLPPWLIAITIWVETSFNNTTIVVSVESNYWICHLIRVHQNLRLIVPDKSDKKGRFLLWWFFLTTVVCNSLTSRLQHESCYLNQT